MPFGCGQFTESLDLACWGLGLRFGGFCYVSVGRPIPLHICLHESFEVSPPSRKLAMICQGPCFNQRKSNFPVPFLPLLLCLLHHGGVQANPEYLSCARPITVGSYVMHIETVEGSRSPYGGQKVVGLKRNKVLLNCGSVVAPCEDLELFVSTSAGETGLQFVAEVTTKAPQTNQILPGFFPDAQMSFSGYGGETPAKCLQRTIKSGSGVLAKMPAINTTVVARAVWAYEHSQTYSSADCEYIVSGAQGSCTTQMLQASSQAAITPSATPASNQRSLAHSTSHRSGAWGAMLVLFTTLLCTAHGATW